MLRDGKVYGPDDYRPPQRASHDTERIARAEAKRARKAAKRANLLKAKPCPYFSKTQTACESRRATRCTATTSQSGREWDSDGVVTEKNYAAHCAEEIRARGNQ